MAQAFSKLVCSTSLLLLIASVNSQCSVLAKTGAVHKPVQKPAQKVRTLSSAEIVASLRAANVTDPSYSLSATQSDGELIVTTQKNPKFNDDDTKVQGILIAKTVFDLLPDSIQRTKVLFHDLKSGIFSTVMINRTEIESYGKKLIDQKKLLGSLELEKKKDTESSSSGGDSSSGEGSVTSLPADAVVEGPLRAERMKEYGNIEFLKSKGADVSRLQTMFAAQEAKARTGSKEAVLASVNAIAGVISEQTKAFFSAQATANGKTVRMDSDFSSNKKLLSRQSGRSEPLGRYLKFLSRKGVPVERQWEELRAEQSLPIESDERKRRREALATDVMSKIHSLSSEDQAELNNSLRFGGKFMSKPDNSTGMTRGLSNTQSK